jgi:hypothetical protein
MNHAQKTWLHATPKRPCSVCGHTNWCSRSEDGRVMICRRLNGNGSVERQDKNGSTYWLYPQDDARKPRFSSVADSSLPSPANPVRAGSVEMDMVYRTLLRALPLGAQHRRNLRERGLNDRDIMQRGYRTLPLRGRSRIAAELVKQFGPEVCAVVPGFIRKQGDRTPYWTLAGSPGLLIPCRDLDCRIFGLNVRRDEAAGGGKYLWLSSTNHGGPGPAVAWHVPLHAGDTRTVRVTEGVLKADVTTALSNTLTIGIPGAGLWRMAIPVLERIRPDTVLLAWDADWRHNPHVAKSLGDCAWELNDLGYDVEFEFWQPRLGKGIDDVLANGHQPEGRHWTQALAASARGQARFINEVKSYA